MADDPVAPIVYRLVRGGVVPKSADVEKAMAHAVQVLRSGGLVAFPTETVYGLGADATNAGAVRKIFAAKDRPSDNPVIVHVGSFDELLPLAAALPPGADRLAQTFWPGPLTLIVERSGSVPDEVTAGLDTVAVRAPAHQVALDLIAAAGRPVAAPSANRSGRPSPTRADDVIRDLGGRVDLVLDGGPTAVGVESTVLDLTVTPPVVLRPGAVTAEALAQVLGTPVVHGSGSAQRPRSPGLKYRHYAPAVPVILVSGDPESRIAAIRSRAEVWEQRGERVAVLTPDEHADRYPAGWDLELLGPGNAPEAAARRLFGSMRDLEDRGAGVIFAEEVPEEGIGVAVMNRLRRAATAEIRASRPPSCIR